MGAAARLNRRIDASSDRELAASLLAAIAIGGSLVGFLTFPLPHPEGTDFVAPTIAFLTSIAAGLVLWRRRTTVSWIAIAAVVALGSLVVTVTMLSVPGRSAAYVTYYVWLGIFSFYFLRPRWALAQIAWIAALYGFAVVGDETAGSFELWMNGVATTLGVGLLVLALRTRIEGLIVRLELTARTDQLTGLPNRRAFDEQLSQEIARARRRGAPLSLLLLDLDRFKQLNDSRGHLAGDDALKVVAATIRSRVREVDWPARIGGDEFAAVLPDAAEPEATLIADRLRETVAAAFAGDPVPLAASVGTATASGGELDAERLLAAADRALYRAKARLVEGEQAKMRA